LRNRSDALIVKPATSAVVVAKLSMPIPIKAPLRVVP
jgi:hypothetical protein